MELLLPYKKPIQFHVCYWPKFEAQVLPYLVLLLKLTIVFHRTNILYKHMKTFVQGNSLTIQ